MKGRVLRSTAFPEGHNPTCHSSVHQVLEQPYELVGVGIRQFQESDMDQVILLHKEWFPLEYGAGFFSKIQNKAVQCKVAEATITQQGETKTLVVGLLVYQYQTASSILQCQKWSEYLYWDYISIYIMTLGVIDEFRNMGLGNRFLQILTKQTQDNPNIKYIYLHMVSYNTAARFYEKNGFESIRTLTNHYDNIKGRPEDAKLYVRFFNGGVKRKGWMEWMKGVWRGE